METDNFEQYKNYVNVRLDALTPVFAKAAVGNFASNIEIPDTDDKFTQLYVGIQVMLEVIRERTHELNELNRKLEQRIEQQTQELRKRTNLLQTIVESIGDGLIVTDMEGRVIMANPAAEHLFGMSITPQSVVSPSVHYGLFYPDTVTLFSDDAIPIFRALKGEKTDNVELFIRNKRVPYGVYVSVTGRPLQDESGKLFGAVSILRDVSAHKHLEEELAKYTAKLEEKVRERTRELEKYLIELHRQEAQEKAVIESIGDGVIAVDYDKKILLVNRAAQEMLGWGAQEMVGRSLLESLPAEDEKGRPLLDEECASMYSMTSGKGIIDKTCYYPRKDGERFPVVVSINPIVLEGQVVGMVNSFRDITREVEIDRTKSELVSLVSHQLRTPPTGIKWYTNMLLGEEVGPITPDQRSYLDEINFNNQRMIDIVNAMLSASRLELGTFSAEAKPTDVVQLIEGVLSELAPQSESRMLSIERNYSSTLPSVMVDPALLRMILQNLIANSVKYTSANGKIILTLALTDHRLEISVADTGCGIPRDEQDKIFTKLFRANNARVLDPSGTGLGLYIVKRVVDELGGTIRFESEENKGATFFISLPVEI